MLVKQQQQQQEERKENQEKKERDQDPILNFLRHLEQRLLFMRVILLVGWTGEVEMDSIDRAQGLEGEREKDRDHISGRLAVLRVVG